MKLFGPMTSEPNKRYFVVSGAPLLDALLASAWIPAALSILLVDPAWIANFITTAALFWFFFRGQSFFTWAEKN